MFGIGNEPLIVTVHMEVGSLESYLADQNLVSQHVGSANRVPVKQMKHQRADFVDRLRPPISVFHIDAIECGQPKRLGN